MDDYDNLLDAELGEAPESPEDAAADADLDEDAEAAADADDDEEEDDEDGEDEDDDEDEPDDDEPDDVREIRERLEKLEAEKAQAEANYRQYQSQLAAANEENQWRQSWVGWKQHFAQRKQQAFAQAQQTLAPLEAYAEAVARIDAEESAFVNDFYARRSEKQGLVFAKTQIPGYATYLAQEYGLNKAQAARLQKIAVERCLEPKDDRVLHPNGLIPIAEEMAALAQSAQAERRAQTRKTLKSRSHKPGAGAPHQKRDASLDDYLDRMLG